MQVEAFTTERLSPSLSVRGWQSQRLTARGYLFKPRGSEPFRASLLTYASQRYRFADVSISPHLAASQPVGSVTRDNPYLLSLINEGTVRILQDGRETFVAAGDIVLVDNSRPLSVEATTLRMRSIDISETSMREVLPNVDGVTAMRVSGQTQAGTALKATVNEAFQLPAEAHEREIDHFGDAVLHLFAAAVTAVPAAIQTVPRRSEAYHRQRVLEFVRLRLREKDLGPQMVAQALDLSPRYIHKLFAGEFMSLMRRVWSERLDRCRRELAMTSLAHCTISEIAYRYGFSHSAHFSRTFTAHFGESPRAFRQRAVEEARLKRAERKLDLHSGNGQR